MYILTFMPHHQIYSLFFILSSCFLYHFSSASLSLSLFVFLSLSLFLFVSWCFYFGDFISSCDLFFDFLWLHSRRKFQFAEQDFLLYFKTYFTFYFIFFKRKLHTFDFTLWTRTHAQSFCLYINDFQWKYLLKSIQVAAVCPIFTIRLYIYPKKVIIFQFTHLFTQFAREQIIHTYTH